MPLVTSIDPAIVRNDQDTVLAISGAGFGEGLKLAIGGAPLANVALRSSTKLTATLPAGLCPGTYTVTITDVAGTRVDAGGQLLVQGRRQISMEATDVVPPPPNIQLNGQDQLVMVPLEAIIVDDTTCALEDIRVVVTVKSFTQTGRTRGALIPRSIEVPAPGLFGLGQSSRTPFSGNDGDAQATLTIKSTGKPGVTRVNTSVEIQVPANAYAGRYNTTATVSDTSPIKIITNQRTR